MATSKPLAVQKLEYERAADAYLASLTIENIMEATTQARQRAITLASLLQLRNERPDIHVHNELLVQYRLKSGGPIHGVVPDNMVVIHDGELKEMRSYDLPFQPARPFWMLEYVSRSSKRKDYETNFIRYEQELKTPYYLLFYPDDEELSLYCRRKGKYVSIKPNARDRLSIEELELEMGLYEGWVRFWFRGELLQLPADLRQELQQVRLAYEALQIESQNALETLRLESQNKDSRLAQQDAELARLRAEIERLRGAG